MRTTKKTPTIEIAFLEITFDPDRFVEDDVLDELKEQAYDLLGDVPWIDLHDENYGRFRRLSVWRVT